MKKHIILAVSALMVGIAGVGGTVSAKNSYTTEDLQNLQDFILAKETPDLSNKDYDLNDDNRWDVFDLCMMRKEVITDKIEFGTQTRDGFIVDNVLHSDTQGDIHFSSYISESYDGNKPYALFVTLPGWEGLAKQHMKISYALYFGTLLDYIITVKLVRCMIQN